jgi:hypothetical protein
MPWVALPDSLQPCGSTYFHGFVSNNPGHRNFSYDIIDDFFIQHPFLSVF